MKLKNIRLGISNVNTTTNRKDFEVVETRVNRIRNEDGSWGRDFDSYSINCLAFKGDILKVKVPKELSTKVTSLTDAISDDVIVTVTFQNLKLKAYALKNNDGSIISGVSAKADDFEFKVHQEDDLDGIII